MFREPPSAQSGSYLNSAAAKLPYRNENNNLQQFQKGSSPALLGDFTLPND
jgi:hypothetical protein